MSLDTKETNIHLHPRYVASSIDVQRQNCMMEKQLYGTWSQIMACLENVNDLVHDETNRDVAGLQR